MIEQSSSSSSSAAASDHDQDCSSNNLKQISRCLFLLGNHLAAISVLDKIQQKEEDWEIWHNKGLCFMYLQDLEKAVDCLRRANEIIMRGQQQQQQQQKQHEQL
eukprot:TRINITY_DN5261_c0_g1_i1.p1 TRINITY_DN5261_c0_g1~~TRINITY_DN5261_c0_g1_i1.p1  ORF type:complete len:104 (-),score=46.85 TRINITY_DN5261_c0_g1_i1:106-417(-)